MAFLYYAVIFVHILACLFLIGVVLLQQGKSQDLASAFGGGGTQTAFGPRGSANVLSRATTILAGVFMVTSLSLSILRPRSSTILDSVQTPAASPAPGGSAAPAPATTLPGQSSAAPAGAASAPAPAAPAPATAAPAATTSPASR
jgi:preprotein translocase subunit SecG